MRFQRDPSLPQEDKRTAAICRRVIKIVGMTKVRRRKSKLDPPISILKALSPDHTWSFKAMYSASRLGRVS